MRRITAEIREVAKKYDIDKKTPIENWPKEMSEKFSAAIKGAIGIKTKFKNGNDDLNEGDQIKWGM